MHASDVLREEVLAVEVIRTLGIVHACAEVAAPEAETEVLRGDVALPFVLGTERAAAAIDGKSADEWTRVGSLDMFAVFGQGLEGFGGMSRARCRGVC